MWRRRSCEAAAVGAVAGLGGRGYPGGELAAASEGFTACLQRVGQGHPWGPPSGAGAAVVRDTPGCSHGW